MCCPVSINFINQIRVFNVDMVTKLIILSVDVDYNCYVFVLLHPVSITDTDVF